LRCSPAFRTWLAALWFLAALPALSQPLNAAAPASSLASSNIVIGFVGGFVDHDNPHHGPVQLAQRIRRTVPPGTYVRVFENRRRSQAYNAVVRHLDTNRDGVIFFGHSWGAAAAVMLARELGQQGIPVLLTVQVDSVAKWWQNDSVIPENVAQAVNFYQTQGIIHGRRQITAANPARTEILGNYLVDYKKTPVACPLASWWDRVFTPGHMQSECDPNLWSQIENMVTQRLSPQPTSVAVSPADHAQSSR
jgi:hypothetical protein